MTLEYTFDFLKALAKNNTREWVQENKKNYTKAKDEFAAFIEQIIQEIAAFDDSVQGLQPKECIFRLNRDVRFSKDKSPYKLHFGAAIMEGGRKSPNPTYYLHIEPGKSFLAGGIYMPEAESLKKIRQEIDYNPSELKDIVSTDSFVNTFGKMTGEQLKTAPKGYPKDHPNIELLRFKSFLASCELKDAQVLDPAFSSMVIEDFKVLYPFNRYFAVAIS